MSTPEQYFDAGMIPPFLDRIHGRTRQEIDAERASLRHRERKAATLKMPTQREINKFRKSAQANIGMSVKDAAASGMARKGA